ncbi:MAG: polysulfide reductase NrfD [Actinomycetota bacterium]|nr:polysulfide reductase NrfD [Actinomycetota bacterium]
MVQATKNFFIAWLSIFKGGPKYYLWLAFLACLMGVGVYAYIGQAEHGLIMTAMRDQVSWGFYISNFTFLVGVAAAAVLLVIPAYVHNHQPIKKIVLFGELMAITAIIMCILFIMTDLGQPLRVWHILPPPIGMMHWPTSLLAWDVLVLNGYFILNVIIAFYVMYKYAHGEHYEMKSVIGFLIYLSIPAAISIHTVTAFLYNAAFSRPFWSASILAPRFIASALCSGPALMLLVFQVLRKVTDVEIEDKAIFRVATLITYAMAVNLFFLLAEVFGSFYPGTAESVNIHYLFFGIDGQTNLVKYIWTAVACNVTAFVLILNPKTREKFATLNFALVLMIVGIYLEKGMGLVIPGFTPDVLGEIYQYTPTATELLVSLGVWATGAMIYTFLVKFAIPIHTGKLRFASGEHAVTAKRAVIDDVTSEKA